MRYEETPWLSPIWPFGDPPVDGTAAAPAGLCGGSRGRAAARRNRGGLGVSAGTPHSIYPFSLPPRPTHQGVDLVVDDLDGLLDLGLHSLFDVRNLGVRRVEQVDDALHFVVDSSLEKKRNGECEARLRDPPPNSLNPSNTSRPMRPAEGRRHQERGVRRVRSVWLSVLGDGTRLQRQPPPGILFSLASARGCTLHFHLTSNLDRFRALSVTFLNSNTCEKGCAGRCVCKVSE
jgi:hypothetical protein